MTSEACGGEEEEQKRKDLRHHKEAQVAGEIAMKRDADAHTLHNNEGEDAISKFGLTRDQTKTYGHHTHRDREPTP